MWALPSQGGCGLGGRALSALVAARSAPGADVCVLATAPPPSNPFGSGDVRMLDGSSLRSHVQVVAVCGMLGAPGASCTQEQLVRGVHIMAEVLLQLLPRMLEVRGALQCRATSPAPWSLRSCSTNKLQGCCYCTASRHCDAKRSASPSRALTHARQLQGHGRFPLTLFANFTCR